MVLITLDPTAKHLTENMMTTPKLPDSSPEKKQEFN